MQAYPPPLTLTLDHLAPAGAGGGMCGVLPVPFPATGSTLSPTLRALGTDCTPAISPDALGRLVAGSNTLFASGNGFSFSATMLDPAAAVDAAALNRLLKGDGADDDAAGGSSPDSVLASEMDAILLPFPELAASGHNHTNNDHGLMEGLQAEAGSSDFDYAVVPSATPSSVAAARPAGEPEQQAEEEGGRGGVAMKDVAPASPAPSPSVEAAAPSEQAEVEEAQTAEVKSASLPEGAATGPPSARRSARSGPKSKAKAAAATAILATRGDGGRAGKSKQKKLSYEELRIRNNVAVRACRERTRAEHESRKTENERLKAQLAARSAELGERGETIKHLRQQLQAERSKHRKDLADRQTELVRKTAELEHLRARVASCVCGLAAFAAGM